MNIKSNTIVLVIFLSFFTVIIASCSGTANKKQDNETEEQVLTYLATSNIVGLSPILVSDIASRDVMDQIYETLFTFNNKTMEIEPLLASSWQMVDDTTWEISLRDDVFFHDDTKFDAAAVKYTFDKIKDPLTASSKASLLDPIMETAIVSEYKVIIKTNYPYALLPNILTQTNTAIVSPSADKTSDLREFPIGTGPFKYDKALKTGTIELSKNTNYWREEAKIDRLLITTVPDHNTAVSIISTTPGTFTAHVSPALVKRIEKYDELTMEKVPSTQFYYLLFNQASANNSLQLRQSVAQSLNYADIVGKYNDMVYYSQGIIGPQIRGYNPEIEKKIFNVDNNQSFDLSSDNKKLRLLAAKFPYYELSAEIIQAQLEKSGFEVELVLLEAGAFSEEVKNGNFDLLLSSWFNMSGESDEFFYLRLHANFINATNQGGYTNEKFNNLIEEARTTIDENERWDKLLALQDFVLDDYQIIPLFYTYASIVHNLSTHNIEIDAMGRWSVYKAYLK